MRIEQDGSGWTGLEELSGFLKRVVRARCRDDAEADDVVQEACLRAARYRGSLGSEGRLRPWAARIALNVLADRAGRVQETAWCCLETAEEVPDPRLAGEDLPDGFVRVGPWLLEPEEAVRQLRSALGGLRPEDRRLLATFYGRGESCRHAAAACGLDPSLAKVRLFRARRRLGRLVRQRASLVATRWMDHLGRVHQLKVRA